MLHEHNNNTLREVRQARRWNDERRQPDARFRNIRRKSAAILESHTTHLQLDDQLLHPVLRS